MTLKTRCFLMLSLTLLVIALGCTSTKRLGANVRGKVTHKGEIVGGGTISFYPKGEEQGGGYGYPIKADGTYEGTTMPAGDYDVAIETESNNPDRKNPEYGGARGRGEGGKKGQSGSDFYQKKMRELGKAPPATEAKGPYVKINPKYNDKKKSGLTATLTNGKNEKNFDLE